MDLNCKVCKSDKIQKFAGELTTTPLSIESVKEAPVYVCQQVLICVDCGFAELVIPPQELERLRKLSRTISS